MNYQKLAEIHAKIDKRASIEDIIINLDSFIQIITETKNFIASLDPSKTFYTSLIWGFSLFVHTLVGNWQRAYFFLKRQIHKLSSGQQYMKDDIFKTKAEEYELKKNSPYPESEKF